MSPSHLTHTWRVSPQANSALEHPLNPAPRALGQRQSCAPGRWRARDGSGARVGAGTCMAYQLRGRVLGGWVFSVGALPPRLSGFGAGLWAGSGAAFWAGCPAGSTDRSSRSACFAGCGSECGSSHRAWPVSQPSEELERSQLLHTDRRHPSPRPCQQDPPDQAWLAAAAQPLSPGSKGSGGWSSAGCRQCIPLPPSAACKAAWAWLHHPPGPSSARG